MEKLAYPHQWLAPLTVKMVNDLSGELEYRFEKAGLKPGVDFEIECRIGEYIAPARYSFVLRGLTDNGKQAVDAFAARAAEAFGDEAGEALKTSVRAEAGQCEMDFFRLMQQPVVTAWNKLLDVQIPFMVMPPELERMPSRQQ